MKCLICKHGDTAPGKAKAALTRGNSVIIIKDVPAEICQNGGEYYLSEEITQRGLYSGCVLTFLRSSGAARLPATASKRMKWGFDASINTKIEHSPQRVLALAEDAVRQGVEVEEDVTPTRAERNHDHSWRIQLD